MLSILKMFFGTLLREKQTERKERTQQTEQESALDIVLNLSFRRYSNPFVKSLTSAFSKFFLLNEQEG